MSLIDRSFSEKRDFIRMKINSPAFLKIGEAEIPAKCHDLSSTGLQVEARCELQEGQRVTVTIPSEHAELQSLTVEAEVIRVTTTANGQLLGLSILSMN